MILAIERVLAKNLKLMEIIKAPLLEEPYRLEEYPIDLTLLESTMSIKYEFIEDLDVVISIDEAIYTLQTVSRLYEQLYSVVYSNQDIKRFGVHNREEYIEICRNLLISAISVADKELKSVIEEIEKYSSPPDDEPTTNNPLL